MRLLPYGPRHDEIDPQLRRLLERLERSPIGSRPALVLHGTTELFARAPRVGFARRIGATIFETDRIPQHWVSLCNRMDEIWVPSRFNVETFVRSGVDPQKLAVIPYAIDSRRFAPRQRRAPAGPFTFLYVCAFGWRKGIDLLLEAFLNEFRRGEARLLLRVYSEGYQGVAAAEVERVLMESIAARLERPAEERPEVVWISDALPEQQLRELYLQADLYVSTDRANGWGVPCQEAMALGVPAATINWSGSTEFMRADNALLIEPTGELEPVDPRLAAALPHLYAGHRWARVEVGEVRRVLRFAAENPQRLAKLAAAGARYVREELDVEVVAHRIVEQLRSAPISRPRRLAAEAGLAWPWIATATARQRLAQRFRASG